MTNKRVDFITPDEFLSRRVDFYESLVDKAKVDMHCAAPAIIKSFDSVNQTITAQLVTKERVFNRGVYEQFKMGEIPDVPIFMPKSGNFIITTPIRVGDECLLIFCDTCIDGWFQNGGEENTQKFQRRHDINDCFALCGIWNQTKKITDYSEDSLQIRSLDGEVCIDVADEEISITAPTKISVVSSGTMEIQSTGETTIESSGAMSINSTGAMTIESEATVDLSAPIVNITSDGVLSMEGQASLEVKSSGPVSVAGNPITIANGVKGVARVGDDVDPLTMKIKNGSETVFAG